MIQRIQSIWLLLAAMCSFLSLKCAFYTGIIMESSINTGAAMVEKFKELTGMENMFLNIATIATGLLSIVALFMYKQRSLQQRICWAAIGTELLVLTGYYFAVQKYTKGSVAFMAILQVFVFLSLILAIVGIRKDAAIVAESDRLR